MNKELVNKMVEDADNEINELIKQEKKIKENMIEEIEAAERIFINTKLLTRRGDLILENNLMIDNPVVELDEDVDNSILITTVIGEQLCCSAEIDLDNVIGIEREDSMIDYFKYSIEMPNNVLIEITNNILD
ncbi:hypothetical protein [Clostridium sp. C8-1-8]|uniref:hypothetical protein n=1 Tax=Clostridium sp. C8-1-8 TaxID=2698831 RepID=UPI0013683005|nr:hypothetical protein [Clostridium sp. C8-1-8]